MAIEIIGAPPASPLRVEVIKARILRLVAAGVCLPAWPGIRQERWRCLPGALVFSAAAADSAISASACGRMIVA